jgi:ornithine decarboxylase
LAGWTGGVLMRIRADDPEARCNLGIKYGAEKYEWKKLLGTCADLGLKLVGVSFHVGSMARNASAFQDGILSAIEVIEMAKGFNFDPKLVDIGGGFSSNEIFDLGPVPEKINDTIALFPDITFIAEPGRYFAEHVGTLVTPVIGVKGPGVTISESLYGSFNCILFDHAIPSIAGYIVGDEFKEPSKDDIHRILFGSTCDGGDILSNQILLLKNLKEGDWIVWPRMGAYTSAATTRFNGIPFNERQTFVIRT